MSFRMSFCQLLLGGNWSLIKMQVYFLFIFAKNKNCTFKMSSLIGYSSKAFKKGILLCVHDILLIIKVQFNLSFGAKP